ncbi:RNA polymerase sigma factor [Labedaea rhizosphaerae]|uniref:RNA polymerase sigma-70 factor (ECF subfamily) n=1 Tax=Labedaea rhizosphaerae TaxID=598644 RepID=A0A4V3D054_LABRH|nr:sigma-70 family RNA polymerase sigma factor [Labedaea rhizosphaerae]TDQ04465.1 RNA polymerase sigma-70 factor (ECF subfamily) [Labedaea rhizosphaerae]
MAATDAVDIEELALRARDGDQAALNRLLGEIQPLVMRRCNRMLPHRQDAEEACQDVLLAVTRNIGKFRGTAKFSTWLHVVAANSARQTYRALKRRAAEQGTDELPPVAEARTTSVIAGTRLDLMEALERLEREKPDMLAPVVMRELGQLEYADIAAQLGRPLGTVKSQIHDARKFLRDYMAERYA